MCDAAHGTGREGGGIMCDAAHGTVRKGGGDHV